MEISDLRKLVLLYRGKIEEQTNQQTIRLIIHDKHCWLVTDLKLFMSPYTYCLKCDIAHKKPTECPDRKCHLCFNDSCKPTVLRTHYCKM